MSNYSAMRPYHDDDFEIDCPKCGAKNRVSVTKQDGHNEPEEYHCAGCREEIGKVRASITPTTFLVSN